MKEMKFSALMASLFSLLLLTACGGGSSGGGGGGFVGTYSGTFTLVGTSGGQTASESGSTTVVINPNGTVVFDPGTDGEFTGTITGNTLTAEIPGSTLNEPGFTCTGSLILNATGSGDTFNGTFSGTTTCNGVTIEFSGTFMVTRVDSASRATFGVAPAVKSLISK